MGVEILKDVAAEDILEGIFRYYAEDIESGQSTYDDAWPAQWRSLDADGEFYKLIAPGLYGGRNVLEGADTNPVTTLAFMGISRVRIVAQEQLIPGDIIVVNENADAFDASAWLYMDGQLLDLQTGETTSAEPMLSQLISRNYFAVIRPSLGM